MKDDKVLKIMMREEGFRRLIEFAGEPFLKRRIKEFQEGGDSHE